MTGNIRKGLMAFAFVAAGALVVIGLSGPGQSNELAPVGTCGAGAWPAAPAHCLNGEQTRTVRPVGTDIWAVGGDVEKTLRGA